MELLHQQLKGAKEQLRDASFQAQEQKETAAIFKQKYTAAIEKVHRMQGQVGLLEEELQYSQQQVDHRSLYYSMLPLLYVVCYKISSPLCLFSMHSPQLFPTCLQLCE